MAKNEHKCMTAPLAIIKINSIPVGKMKNVRITENIRRGRVAGIGRLSPTELPPLEWQGTLSCSSYSIDFRLLANEMEKGTYRGLGSYEEWAHAILLEEDGLQIEILRKVKDGEIDVKTGAVKTKFKTFAKVAAAFATREGFDLQEGQISGRDTDFEYLEPILYSMTDIKSN